MPLCKKIFFLVLCFFSSLSTAAIFGQVTIQDPLYQVRSLTYEDINGFAVVEGDILLGKIKDMERKPAIFRLKVGGNHWEQGLVPFEMAAELPLQNKMAVLQAIIHWQEKTNIQFVELNSTNRSFYKDYVSFVPTQGTTCSSYVGRQGGRQVINLSVRCSAMITVHEIGHALGLWHEQSRGDRSNYIRILWDNIEENHKFNFEQHLTDGIDFGEYDYQSIMHYGPYAFSKNGEKTIIPLLDSIEIGQRAQVSEKDIAVVNAMYPKTEPHLKTDVISN